MDDWHIMTLMARHDNTDIIVWLKKHLLYFDRVCSGFVCTCHGSWWDMASAKMYRMYIMAENRVKNTSYRDQNWFVRDTPFSKCSRLLTLKDYFTWLYPSTLCTLNYIEVTERIYFHFLLCLHTKMHLEFDVLSYEKQGSVALLRP